MSRADRAARAMIRCMTGQLGSLALSGRSKRNPSPRTVEMCRGWATSSPSFRRNTEMCMSRVLVDPYHAVSYTHLDVYKRQDLLQPLAWRIEDVEVIRAAQHPDALAVVSTPGGIGDDRPADSRSARLDVHPGAGLRAARAGHANLRQPMTHGQLVLSEAQRCRAGMQRDPVGFQSGQHVGRDVLVVEGDDVTGGGEPAYGMEVGVVTHWSRRDDQGRSCLLYTSRCV